MVGWTDSYVGRWVVVRMEGQMGRETEKTDRHKEGQKHRQTDGLIDGWTDSQVGRWVDGWMEGYVDSQTN